MKHFLCSSVTPAAMLAAALLLVSCGDHTDTLFQAVPAEVSGIEFTNRIVESDSMNMLDYEYLYSGGGVAVADFNNDSLPDLYFVGNVVKNRLYLNRGDMRFRDVTGASGAASSGRWHTGVSTVDINNDGWTDIYLSVARSEIPENRRNVLLVHQGLDAGGIPVFEDRAEAYGLANPSFSTQTAFFDYDNDGDLDMYEVVADKRRKGREYSERSEEALSGANIDNLFRNDWDSTRGHPYFTEISVQAGITNAGYGLGLGIVDINRDGWKDIYVSNDFVSNDLFWINNGNGTFTDRAGTFFKHTSFSAMGADVADINNDGRMDVMSLDMAGSNNIRKQTMSSPNNYQNYFNNTFERYDPQYTRNTLQLNQGFPSAAGHPVFSEIALLAGVAETDWSWGVLMADFDNDSFNDMVITNGIPRNKIDKDFIRFRNQMSTIAPKSMLLDSIPRDKSRNVSFRNNGNLTFSNSSKSWGLDAKAYSTGLSWADLDDDGDLDLVMNNINDHAFLYENTLNEKRPDLHWLKVRFKGGDRNVQGLGAVVDVYHRGQHQTRAFSPYRGYLSTVEPMVHFGVGETAELDSVVVRWKRGTEERRQIWKQVATDQTLQASYAEAETHTEKHAKSAVTPPLFRDITAEKEARFFHTEQEYADFGVQRMLPFKLSQFGPSLTVGDINGDGLPDLYIGGSLRRQGSFLIQQQDGSFKKRTFHPVASDRHGMREDAGALLFDADNDGDRDLYVASGSVESSPESAAYRDRLYENDGDGSFTFKPDALPAFKVSGSAVKASDYDRDGDLDLFVGGRVLPGFYPAPVSSYILENKTGEGGITFADVTSVVAPDLKEIGMVTDALWTDFNDDGWQDLVVAGEWMPLTFLQNSGGRFQDITGQTGLAGAVGWWNSLVGGDFDNDGDTDYVAGNLGLNTIYRASTAEPVGVYADDFDGNGAYDAILTLFNRNAQEIRKEFPAHKFEDFHWQLPRRAQRISEIRQYAAATVHDLFSPRELDEALSYRATEMRSSYIENQGGGNFTVKPLPLQAQFAPVFGMVAADMNEDGNLDVVLNGNAFGAEVQMGRYDALNGLLLKGDGSGGFKAASVEESGIFIPGDGKALVEMARPDSNCLLFAAQNQGALKAFGRPCRNGFIKAGPLDTGAILYFGDGRRRKVEFYYGSSFFSASGRFFEIPEGIEKIEMVNYRGEKRDVVINPEP